MLRVRIKVLRGMHELGTIEGDLDETKLPMHKADETSNEGCVDALKGHVLKMETAANDGPLRLHVESIGPVTA